MWSRTDQGGRYYGANDASTLKMQTDGNLVLRTRTGHVLWASNTARTGAHNFLDVFPNGDVVMFTSPHHEVWSTGTTDIYLGSGSSKFAFGDNELLGGLLLDDRRGDQFPGFHESTLTMQVNGNLVYRCGTTVLWQSHTSSPDAYLAMQNDGNLVIYAYGFPKHALWASGTSHAGPYTWFDSSQMKIMSSTAGPVWSAGLPASPCHSHRDNPCRAPVRARAWRLAVAQPQPERVLIAPRLR